MQAVARLALPTSQVQTRINQLQRTLLITMLFTAGIAVGLAALIAENTTRPLRRLTQAVTRFNLSRPRPQTSFTQRWDACSRKVKEPA